MPLRVPLKLKNPNNEPVHFTVDFPDSLEACQAAWDGPGALEQTTYELVIAGARAQLTEHIRRLMRDHTTGRGKRRKTHHALTQAEIQEFINSWKPEAHKRSKASIKKVAALVSELSLEEREVLLQSIQESL